MLIYLFLEAFICLSSDCISVTWRNEGIPNVWCPLSPHALCICSSLYLLNNNIYIYVYIFNLNLDQIITGRVLIILFSLISLYLGTLKSTNSSNSVLHLIGDLNLDPGNAILNLSVAFLESDHIETLSWFITLDILDWKQHIHLIYLKCTINFISQIGYRRVFTDRTLMLWILKVLI